MVSMATLERAILARAKVVFNNPKLKLKDLKEWSTAELEKHEGEVIGWIPDPGIWVSIPQEQDKRLEIR